MSIETIERDFHEKVSEHVRLAAEGMDRFRVFTPFMFEDDDHLSIVLKKEGTWCVLSDETYTYMYFSYNIDEKDLHNGIRQQIISNALSRFRVKDDDRELTFTVPDERYDDAVYPFVQAPREVPSGLPNQRRARLFLVHSLTNDGQTRDTTTALLQFEKWRTCRVC